MTTITANSTIGVYLTSPTYTNPIVINPGVTISSTSSTGTGVYATTGYWAIQNNGIVTSSNGMGVELSSGSITNAASASITGAVSGVEVTGVGTVVNDGSIAATGTGGLGVGLGSGSVTNAASASITGDGDGVAVFGAGTVVNDGSIAATGTYGTGVDLTGGGSVTNAASASITGSAYGVLFVDGSGTVVNHGSIAGTGTSGIGVDLSFGGSVTNAASASIYGKSRGVYLYDGTLTNTGTVIGASGTAVAFGGIGSNLLVLDPGYGLSGLAIGGTSASNTLELTSAASSGTLSGLGTEFVDFGQTTIDADASWVFNGANTIEVGSTLTELTGAVLTVTGTLVNDGSIVLDPSTLDSGGLIGTGIATIEAGSTLEVQGTVSSGETIMFAGVGVGADLVLNNPGSVAGSVTNFGPGDTIDLVGLESVSYSDGLLSFSGGSFPLSLTNPGSLSISVNNGTVSISALCFCANTLISTPSGERPVQELAVGDMVTTHRGAARRIVWVGSGKVLATQGRRNAATPVIVGQSALADNVPNRDLRVTKGHSLYIDDVLIPVEFLVNHRSIYWDDNAQEVELYHIELETHDVLVANGAPAESYRDDGNRWLFRNANSGWGLPPQAPCAPVLTGGPVVDAAWRRLLDRAGPRPQMPTTEEPDLHLLVDGQRVEAAWRGDVWHVFRLPAPPANVRIVSRSGVPQEMGVARDPRCLGVALRRIMVTCDGQIRTIEAADTLLTNGFHQYEAGNGIRWTDGDAGVPAALFEHFAGPLEIAIRLGGRTCYLDEGTLLRAA